MLKSLKNLPIKHKLAGIIIVTSFIALLVAGLALAYLNWRSFRGQKVDRLTTLAQVIGRNSTAALTFNDPAAAGEILSTADAEENLVLACLYDKQRKVFSRYRRSAGQPPCPLIAPRDGAHFADGKLMMVHPITLEKERIGTVFLVDDLREQNVIITQNVIVTVGVMLAAFLIAYLFSIQLQHFISRPVLHLSEIMRRITSEKDYSVRAEKEADDELGELIDGFNNMLIEIRIRENDLERHRDRLEKTLEELRRSQEMVVRAEKLSSLGTLAAGAAHEILNPAGVIQMRAEMIAEDTLRGTLENQSAEIIVNCIDRIRKICDDLRRFSRDELPSTKPIDLGETLRFALGLIDHELTPHGIGVEVNLSESPSVVLADATQIHQVFLNILSNARDAMANGGKISISSLKVESGGKSFWEVRVSDTGTGIPKDILPHIFDPFYTTKDPDLGTGLGLSVLHGIVRSHGGDVFVESDEGEGATFIVRLPKAPEDEEASGASGPQERKFTG